MSQFRSESRIHKRKTAKWKGNRAVTYNVRCAVCRIHEASSQSIARARAQHFLSFISFVRSSFLSWKKKRIILLPHLLAMMRLLNELALFFSLSTCSAVLQFTSNSSSMATKAQVCPLDNDRIEYLC